MKLFTVGPVEMFPETLAVSSMQLPYFRTNDFSEIMLENDRLIKKSVNACEEDRTIFLTASGSGAMEAAVINCFDKNDKVLIVNGGGFGTRFTQICEIHGVAYDEIVIPFGEKLSDMQLNAVEKRNSKYTGLLVNLHETSTGQLYDIKLLSDFCKKNKLFFVVDAISAYGADEVDFSKYGIDVLILSSQKALALAPGLSMVVLSRRMIEERIDVMSPKTFYFNFKDCLRNMDRGQTPFTPAVGIILQLRQRLQSINDNGGIQVICDQSRYIAKMFRKQVLSNGFMLPQYPMSNAMTPILFERGAKEMYNRLRCEYDMTVTPNGGELADKMLRIGHLGNVNWEGYKQLLKAMKTIKETS